MFSEDIKKSILDFMLSLELKNLDAYENVVVKSDSKKVIVRIPFACLTNSTIYLFIKPTDNSQDDLAMNDGLIQHLNSCEMNFASHFGIRPENIMTFVIDDRKPESFVMYYRRPYSTILVSLGDKTQNSFSAFQDLVVTQEMYFQRNSSSKGTRKVGFERDEENFFKTLSAQLDFASEDNEKIKYDSEGNAYIRKRNDEWFRASDIDGRKLFYLVSLGGFLGLHLFYQKRIAKGVLYLLTCGLFGVGWVIDVAELFFGLHKDKNHYYIIPPKISLIHIILCIVIGLLLTLLGTFAFKSLLLGGAGLLQTFAESIASNLTSPQ